MTNESPSRITRLNRVDQSQGSKSAWREIEREYSAQLSLCSAWLRLSLVVEVKKGKSNRAEAIPGNVWLSQEQFFLKLWVQRGRGGKKKYFFFEKVYHFFKIK